MNAMGSTVLIDFFLAYKGPTMSYSYVYSGIPAATHTWWSSARLALIQRTGSVLPLPVVIPRLVGRAIGLESRVLDRHGIQSPDALLLHRHPVQVSLVLAAGALGLPELLAGVVHGRVHPLPLPRDRVVLVAAEHHPRAVDRPVPQPALAGHPQGRRCRGEQVLLEDGDAVVVF